MDNDSLFAYLAVFFFVSNNTCCLVLEDGSHVHLKGNELPSLQITVGDHTHVFIFMFVAFCWFMYFHLHFRTAQSLSVRPSIS